MTKRVGKNLGIVGWHRGVSVAYDRHYALMNKVKGTSVAKLFGTILAVTLILPLFALALWGLFEVLKKAPELTDEQKASSWIAIVGVLVAIAGAIAAIVVAKSAFDIVTSILLKLAVAVAVAAAAVWIMAEAMKAFSEISTETSDQLKNNIQNAIESFPEAINASAESLGRALAAIGNAIIVFILGFFYEICDMIYEQTPNFIEAVTKLLDALDEIIVQCGPALVQLIVDIFGLLNSSWKKDLEPPLEEFFGNIIDFIGKLSPKLVEMVLGIVDDILEGAKNISRYGSMILGKCYSTLSISSSIFSRILEKCLLENSQTLPERAILKLRLTGRSETFGICLKGLSISLSKSVKNWDRFSTMQSELLAI